jgi:DNA polymerase-3 subunit epsilon
MREIVLDTETTGLDPEAGHRLVEVACLELHNHVATGNNYQQYLHPERDMPEEAFRIHGLSADFLADFPVFPEVAEAFLEFVGDSRLVIHNAGFDLKFLNSELERAGLAPLSMERVTDTVALARRRFPGAQVSLDALCRRFEIDNSARTLHGALLDCELLAEVYLELRGGRQPGFDLAAEARAAEQVAADKRPKRPARPHAPSAEESAAHEAFIDSMEAPIWRR